MQCKTALYEYEACRLSSIPAFVKRLQTPDFRSIKLSVSRAATNSNQHMREPGHTSDFRSGYTLSVSGCSICCSFLEMILGLSVESCDCNAAGKAPFRFFPLVLCPHVVYLRIDLILRRSFRILYDHSISHCLFVFYVLRVR